MHEQGMTLLGNFWSDTLSEDWRDFHLRSERKHTSWIELFPVFCRFTVGWGLAGYSVSNTQWTTKGVAQAETQFTTSQSLIHCSCQSHVIIERGPGGNEAEGTWKHQLEAEVPAVLRCSMQDNILKLYLVVGGAGETIF